MQGKATLTFPDIVLRKSRKIYITASQYREILLKKQAPYNRFPLISKSNRKNSFLQLGLLIRFHMLWTKQGQEKGKGRRRSRSRKRSRLDLQA